MRRVAGGLRPSSSFSSPWQTVGLARDGRPVTASPAPQSVPEKEPEFNITGSLSRDDKAHN